MGQELKQTERKRPSIAEEETEHGRRWVAMVWTLITVVVLIVAVIALWGKLATNPSSTVNPHKSLPAASQ